MKVFIASSELIPFAKTGGLADVTGALPLALEKLGEEIVISLPRYRQIEYSKFKVHKLSSDISYSTIGSKIKVYFIENDQLYDRDGLYGDKKGDYPDNLERFFYYCKRSLKLLEEVDFKPDIIHVHDWQASLIPIYLKSVFSKTAFFQGVKTILTIHNLGYQGIFSKEKFAKLDLEGSLFNPDSLEFFGKINLLKGGIISSDLINTVSQTYSKEIQTKEFGFGLEGILNQRKTSLFGILNGLDYSIWNPETDKYIKQNYSLTRVLHKYQNKNDLQKICDLPIKKDIPLFGIVSRLAEQKGFDILAQILERLVKLDIQLVILGTGDHKYHNILEDFVQRYPEVISLHLKFDDSLAHKIYAGSDIFLMPSKYEPCGLGQMISLKYGSIPLVFKTGGLADTINEENGFVFDVYDKDSFFNKIQESIEVFEDVGKWNKLVEKAMGCDFSWEESAKKYQQLYKKALE